MVRQENLDFWIQNGYNVLFVGHAGVGKTAIVKSAFERNNLNYRYFSAATMDPWVDLVGVPRERQDENGESYLDLIRPKGLDQVEALFFDEFNRANKKVRNACMELLQFKSINGRPFPNLKLIWTAINPDDDELYDVEKLDPAQKDRFEIHVEMPYELDSVYFTNKYGPEVFKSSEDWWYRLPYEIRREVSPRRLDYALDVHNKGGDIRFCLPQKSNVSKLLTTLKEGPIEELLSRFFKEADIEGAKKWLTQENNYQAAIQSICSSEKKKIFFLPLLSTERLAALASDVAILRFMLKNCELYEIFADVLSDIYEAKQNSEAYKEIAKAIGTQLEVAEALGYESNAAYRTYPFGKSPVPPYYTNSARFPYQKNLQELMNDMANRGGDVTSRNRLYKHIHTFMPKDITENDALMTLIAIDSIVKRSQIATVKKFPDLIGIVNQCMKSVHESTQLNLIKILNLHSKKFPFLWKAIRGDKKLSSGIIHYGARKS